MCIRKKSRAKVKGGGGFLSYRRPFLSCSVWGSVEQQEGGQGASKWMNDGTWGPQPRQKIRIILEEPEKVLNMALAKQPGSKS